MFIKYVDDKESEAVLSCQRETLFVSNAHLGNASLEKAEGPPQDHRCHGEDRRKAVRLAAGERGARLPIATTARFRGYIRRSEGTFSSYFGRSPTGPTCFPFGAEAHGFIRMAR